jgi:FkbM family methyltransferase
VSSPLKITVGDVDFPFHWNGTEKIRNSALKILQGSTYPLLDNINPKVIFDVGANIGAATVYFALNYKEATIYSFEPTTINFDLLVLNTSHYKNIQVFQKGLFNNNQIEKIYFNPENPERNSLNNQWAQSDTYEEIELIRLDDFLSENKIDKIDLLKIDTEGCEIQILETIEKYLAEIEVIYLEYHSKADKMAMLKLISLSHDIIFDNFSAVTTLLVDQCLFQNFTNYADITVNNKLILGANNIINAKHIQALKASGIDTIKVWSPEMGELGCKKKCPHTN